MLNSSVELNLVNNDSGFEIPEALQSLCAHWTRICVEKGGVACAWVAKVDETRSVYWCSSWPLNAQPPASMLASQENTLYGGNVSLFRGRGEWVSGGLFPLLDKGKVIGLLALGSSRENFFTQENLIWINVLTEAIATAIVTSEEQLKKRHVEYTISQLLQSNLNVEEVLPAVLELLANLVQADAALLAWPKNEFGEFVLLATYGFKPHSLDTVYRYIKSEVNKKSMTARVNHSNVRSYFSATDSLNPEYFRQEGFQSSITLLLKNHGELSGFLEMFWQSPRHEKGDQNIIERVGEEIATVIERAYLFSDIKRRDEEMICTYEATVEGLSRALEFRDLETEGHTRRVSALTIQLAEHMKLPKKMHTALRLGALLHDIGKLGIPDAILLKPGSLTQQEWKIMQQHPLFAYKILAPITSFKNALDIPLYHHERWDGSGYPYGLKKEDIPLVARMFSVVDVYDALTSDRPYRAAWTRSQAVNYLRENSGVLFDARVVEKFLELLNQIK